MEVKPGAWNWGSDRVLVTGAAGFLGGWACKALASVEAHVIGLDISWNEESKARTSDEVEVVVGDVRDGKSVLEILADLKVTAVIHLAAQTLVEPALKNPVDTFEHNIQGTWTILEACRNTSTVNRIIVASSDKAYGDAGGKPYEESTPLRAMHPYDASKASGDLLAQAYAKSYGLPVVISRCGNLYGGGDLNWSRIVPGTIRSILNSERPVIRSDGTYVRDYLYVEDAAGGLLMLTQILAERPELHGQAFNFASGDRLTVLEIVNMILELMESDLEPDIRDEAVNEIPEQRVDSQKAREVLGWAPGHSIGESLYKTIAWYREHLNV